MWTNLVYISWNDLIDLALFYKLIIWFSIHIDSTFMNIVFIPGN